MVDNILEFNRAEFSNCRNWRYTLFRRWNFNTDAKYCMFIGLNPSTADEVTQDPTVTRCCQYAQDWGFDGLCMTNIFAYRATDPKVMKQQDDPVGVDNDKWLIKCGKSADLVVAAWGTHGAYRNRGVEVMELFDKYQINLHALKLTQDGHPGHPLYLKSSLKPFMLEVS
jgi:hypothetical protein